MIESDAMPARSQQSPRAEIFLLQFPRCVRICTRPPYSVRSAESLRDRVTVVIQSPGWTRLLGLLPAGVGVGMLGGALLRRIRSGS
jgi:hypothetical protein